MKNDDTVFDRLRLRKAATQEIQTGIAGSIVFFFMTIMLFYVGQSHPIVKAFGFMSMLITTIFFFDIVRGLEWLKSAKDTEDE